MSRSGYSEDYDSNREFFMWRGAVARAIKGRRGQSFLKEMLDAFDALPEKKLIAHDLEKEGCVCALGAVGKSRGLDMANIDPEDREIVAHKFGIAGALAAETAFMNDEGYYRNETPEHRFTRMREWVQSLIADTAPGEGLTK